MARLTRKAFRAWLASKPRRRFDFVDDIDRECPIGCYMGRVPWGRRLPTWCLEFMGAVDMNGFPITAAKCLRILDGIK